MTYKEQFIKFMVSSGVLTFGEFTLKSGRKSPYFFNAGNYNTGFALAELGNFYAECIVENNIKTDIVFGPSYKGIPLAVATAISLNNNFQKNVHYAFDRKEEKDHGEGGLIVGKQLFDGSNVVIIDDVSTSGKALREVLPKIQGVAKINISAFIITIDRMEKSLNSNKSAMQQIYEDFKIPVYSIINLNDIIHAIEKGVIDMKEHLESIKNYRNLYGV